MKQISSRNFRGWTILTLESDTLSIDIAPEKGGDVISARWLPTQTELLFQTRWGLRHRGIATQPGSSEAAITEWHPGGWQTLFPNAGDATFEHGVDWAFHGEAWITAFDWLVQDNRVILEADLVRSPFHLKKTFELDISVLTVTEEVTNVGTAPIEVMWGHHPAFGAPLLGPDSRVITTARTVRNDHDGDSSPWPHAKADGGTIDLSTLPQSGSGVSRLFYLTDFGEVGRLGLENERLGISAILTWDPKLFPHAWYWLEAGGRTGFPWFGATYTLGLEPNTSYPAHGLPAARSTATQVVIAPGETRAASVSLTVAPSNNSPLWHGPAAEQTRD